MSWINQGNTIINTATITRIEELSDDQHKPSKFTVIYGAGIYATFDGHVALAIVGCCSNDPVDERRVFEIGPDGEVTELAVPMIYK